MGTYTRLGSYLLASELASDPFGALHRGVVIAGHSFDRHVLIRTFSEEFFQAGMNTRLAEAGRVVPLLGGSRAFGLGYRIESGKTPHVVWDYVAGRSLAQLIEKARQEQIPLGVDHALTVIQGVAQGIMQLHGKGVSHGVLSPHSVWVSFEGATQIVDAPYAALAKSMLAKAPAAKLKLAPYLQGPGSDALQLDLFALGAVLYELLTFERLPVGGDLQAVLDQATLKAAQEDAPLPAEIRAFLGRLLLGRQPFATVEAFSAELERVLYDGEYSPTTFNMAFFMHTLFREENDRDSLAMKAEQGDNYLAYTAAGETLRNGARPEVGEGGGEVPGGQKSSAKLIGGGIVAAVVLVLGYMFLSRPKEDPAAKAQLDAAKAQLVEFQRAKAEYEKAKADLEARTKVEAEKTSQLLKQLSESKSAEEKARLKKQLDEAQQRKQDLERQQKAAEQRLAEQRQNEQRRAAEARAALPAPEVLKVQPTPELPKAVVVPPPAVPVAAPSSAQTSESARVVSQVAPVFPQRALQLRLETNMDHYVRLKVFVGDRGQPLKVNITEGVPGAGGFDEAAIEAANKSTYGPATRDGKPARGWTPEIVYKFEKRR